MIAEYDKTIRDNNNIFEENSDMALTNAPSISGAIDQSTGQQFGLIDIVLKLLGSVCDGQNKQLQHYLREQPDNLKSFNLISETAQFLGVIYTSIHPHTIDLLMLIFDTLNEFCSISGTAQFLGVIYTSIHPHTIDLLMLIFDTLNEFCSGNQANREVIINKKVVDYSNFILRSTDLHECSDTKLMELRKLIGILIFSLIEENGPTQTQVAKNVKDTLDKDAVYRIMHSCYMACEYEKKNDKDKHTNQIADERETSFSQFDPDVQLQGTRQEQKEELFQVGFIYYTIMSRFYDIDPLLSKVMVVSPEHNEAWEFFRNEAQSIEILKDDILQKINFRVKNKNIIREEIKEKLKWAVDRTSSTSKIRDLMTWSKNIIADLGYQRMILSNPFVLFFTQGWLLWNNGVILLSLAINILMMVVWKAPLSLGDFDADDTPANSSLWTNLTNPVPDVQTDFISETEYRMSLYTLGIIHNIFSIFVLLGYFLANHPRFPSIKWKFWKTSDPSEQVEQVSELDVRFFSFSTVYYLVFVGMSIGGTLFHGYCFAFHLLNIVCNNQLLGGVIRAVTLNGKSLLWVAILGLIIMYIYALLGFALLRGHFDPGTSMYCSTLPRCMISILRYGLIGDLPETMVVHESQQSFDTFWPIVIYQLTFFIFITTIGLNIIFGIIVDTFSELRDLKWRAESDMKETCYICGRSNYDFETGGNGFEYHIANDHNMWAYIFFLIHIDDMTESDYSALELYVYKRLKEKNYDFFPMDRALCLSDLDQGTTDSKIDTVMEHLARIEETQRVEIAERTRREARLKQLQWTEDHKYMLEASLPEVIKKYSLSLAAKSRSTSDIGEREEQPQSVDASFVTIRDVTHRRTSGDTGDDDESHA